MQKKTYKFFDSGSPLVSIVDIMKASKNIKIVNPETIKGDKIQKGALARVHSKISNSTLYVWVNDPETYHTIHLEVPEAMMSMLFKQHDHGIYPHFA